MSETIDKGNIELLDELRLLKRQVESAISMVEMGNMFPMTDEARIEHARRFGVGAFIIGDFVIRRYEYFGNLSGQQSHILDRSDEPASGKRDCL